MRSVPGISLRNILSLEKRVEPLQVSLGFEIASRKVVKVLVIQYWILAHHVSVVCGYSRLMISTIFG